MKLKLINIWQAVSPLSKVFNFAFDDARVSYAISKVSKKITAEVEDINKQRLSIIEKHSEKDDNGKSKIDGPRIVIKDSAAFEKEWLAFLDTEIEVDLWKIPFKAIEAVKLTPNELVLLERFIEEPKQEAGNES